LLSSEGNSIFAPVVVRNNHIGNIIEELFGFQFFADDQEENNGNNQQNEIEREMA